MIHQNISELKKELGSVKLVVVSKYRSMEELNEVYASGHRLMGENRVQELRNKFEEMPKDVEWHMIGHLQKNKVKYIAPFIAMIHSVDSESLLKEINKQAAKHERVIPVLLQVHVAQEETKFGLDSEELSQLLNSDIWQTLNNIEVRGLMAMATNTKDMSQVSKEFSEVKQMQDRLQLMDLPKQFRLEELSMGMSSDYKTAIDAGSTMVRIGSKVFE